MGFARGVSLVQPGIDLPSTFFHFCKRIHLHLAQRVCAYGASATAHRKNQQAAVGCAQQGSPTTRTPGRAPAARCARLRRLPRPAPRVWTTEATSASIYHRESECSHFSRSSRSGDKKIIRCSIASMVPMHGLTSVFPFTERKTKYLGQMARGVFAIPRQLRGAVWKLDTDT